MQTLPFIIELIDKLVWPAVYVFTLICLRKPVSHLLPLARKLKYKELELEFGRELKVANEQAEGAFPELKQDTKAKLVSLVENMPNTAVIKAWALVDDAAENLLHSLGLNVNLDVNNRYKVLEDTLIEQGAIDTKMAKLFSELRQLRNKVAHAETYEVGRGEAIQYIELCVRLRDHFNLLSKQEPAMHAA
ncbi:DUF4145 domain-containing protein [Agaribacterium sp. ZY112]|uniref:DUF4145 domain-containing protein n=1 Tax=Agaribacterium sp. ZY112 TaxID=3233574 RepID=UPI0035268344